MDEPTEISGETAADGSAKRFSLGTVVIVAVTAVLLTGAAIWAVKAYLFPTDFRAVELSEREVSELNDKLGRLGIDVPAGSATEPTDYVEPEAYSERDADRLVSFTERELNSLIARDPDLASRLAIDLSDDLASAKLIIPMDPDFPVLGGKTLRINAGLELAYEQSRPVVVLRGVSVMGVPIPNAWLGNLKNVDLVGEFGASPGFWNAFAAGIEFIEVADGELNIRLHE